MTRPMCSGAALLIAATAVISTAGPAAAAEDATVKLPTLVSRIADGSACTKASDKTVAAVPWEQQRLDLARTWQFATGSGVTVAVVDTGVDSGAAALKGRVGAVGDAGGDCVGHGTFVAGLIAAAPLPGVRFTGVAQAARILAVRGTDERGEADATTVAQGIRAAVKAGADVIDVSPALTQRSASLTSAVAYAVDHDVLIVAAAVPDSPKAVDSSSPPPPADYWPAAEDGVLAVLDVDGDGQRPVGSYTTGRADLAAPGVGVMGIGPRGKGHFVGTGASLAAAYVAGTAALVRSAYPDLTAAEAAERITSTAYPAEVPRIDPYAAITAVKDRHPAAVRDARPRSEPVRLASGNAGEGSVRRALIVAAAGAGLTVVVAWAGAVVSRGRRRGADA